MSLHVVSEGNKRVIDETVFFGGGGGGVCTPWLVASLMMLEKGAVNLTGVAVTTETAETVKTVTVKRGEVNLRGVAVTTETAETVKTVTVASDVVGQASGGQGALQNR